MDADLIYRTGPFVILALILLGWALIEWLQTRREDMDGLTWTISFAGLAGALYLGSLGLNWTSIDIAWHDRYFEAIRLSLWLLLPGVPIVWLNVWRAFRARRRGQFRRKVVYDLPPEPPAT